MLIRMLQTTVDANLYRIDALDGLELVHVKQSQHNYAKHVHEEYSLCIMHRGLAGIHHRGVYERAGTHTITVMHPDEVHACWAADSSIMSYTMLYPSEQAWQTLSRELFGVDCPPYFRQLLMDDTILIQKMQGFLDCLAKPLEAESRYYDLTAHLMQCYTDTPRRLEPIKRESNAVATVQAYVHEHYSETIHLSDLANLVGLNPSYLTRVFKKTLGMPPHQYQTNVRLLAAKRLLKTHHSLVEIAHSLGFSDQSHFSRAFKRRYGLTPRQYQKVKNVQDFRIES